MIGLFSRWSNSEMNPRCSNNKSCADQTTQINEPVVSQLGCSVGLIQWIAMSFDVNGLSRSVPLWANVIYAEGKRGDEQNERAK